MSRSPQSDSNDVTRRRLFGLGGRVAAAGLVGSSLWPASSPAAGAAVEAWPTSELPASAAGSVVSSQFTSAEQLAAYGAEVNAMGLRVPGTDLHGAYVHTLADRFREAGLQDVRLEPVPHRRWLCDSWSLDLDGKTVPYTYYAPYSKGTGPEGVTAPTVYVPLGELLTGGIRDLTDLLGAVKGTRGVRGKIVVFQVPYLSIPIQGFNALSYPGGFNTMGRSPNQLYTRPWLNLIGSLLKSFQQAGAVGTIGIWPDLPGEWAKQYTPYDAEFREIPSLWIDRDQGKKLKARARKGATATIKLQAQVTDTFTHNLIGFIPGQSEELTVLHTHTDGTNGMEENGQIGILATAQYLARLPKESLGRTVMVLLSSGHFAGGVGIKSFLKDHAGDVVPRITSIHTLEHLGCMEYVPTRDGAPRPTGRPEIGAAFAPNSKAMVAALKDAGRRNAIPNAVVRPFYPAPKDATRKKIGWPGEGTYFWWFGAINTGNYITGPYGLITADLDTTGMVDYEQVRREAMTAVGTVLQLASASKRDLKAS